MWVLWVFPRWTVTENYGLLNYFQPLRRPANPLSSESRRLFYFPDGYSSKITNGDKVLPPPAGVNGLSINGFPSARTIKRKSTQSEVH